MKPAPATALAPARNARLWAAFLTVGALCAYGPALRGGFLWDDDVYVSNNVLLTAPDGLSRIWFSRDSPSQYFPLVYTTFRIERALWGLDTLGYHLVNVALHVVNALLLWLALALLGVPGAWLAAGLFVLHPVHVESVAWITERKNVLSTAFYLLALIAWIKSIDPACVRPRRFYAFALVLFLLALFSKTTTCTLPVALALALWIKGGKFDRRRVLQIAVFAAFGLGMGLFTIWWERHLQGALGRSVELTHMEALLVAGRAFWFYLGKLLWPAGLSFSYARWEVNPQDWRQWLWPAAAFGAFAALAVRSWRNGERAAFAAASFFLAALSPLLGFIPLYTFQYSFVADHYQYVASMAVIALAAAAWTTRYAPEERAVPRLSPAVCVLLAALGLCTWNRARAYASAEALWRDTIEKNPRSWLSYDNLGSLLMDQGAWAEAEKDLRRSIALNPKNFRSHYNLGNLYARRERRTEALAAYDEALRLEPNHVKSRVNRAGQLVLLGSTDEAQAEYRRAIQLDSGNALARGGLARALMQAGRQEEAFEEFRRALELNPGDAALHNGLGMLLAKQGRWPQAAEQYRQAIALAPGQYHAHNNLANALLHMGLTEGAVEEYRTALLLAPDFPEAHFNLALAFERRGLWRQAVAEYDEALRLKPDFPLAAQRRAGAAKK